MSKTSLAKRPEVITVRLSAEEKKELQDKAQYLNLSQSECIRFLLSVPIVKIEDYIDSWKEDDVIKLFMIDDKTYKTLTRNLRSIGVLYNQATRTFNALAQKNYYRVSIVKEMLERIYDDLDRFHERVAELDKTIEALQLKTSKTKEIGDGDDDK